MSRIQNMPENTTSIFSVKKLEKNFLKKFPKKI
jgi:hypothetical protein